MRAPPDRSGDIVRGGRRLVLPRHWTTVRGLWLRSSGLNGSVLTDSETIWTFEQRRVIEVDVRSWTIIEIIECLATLKTPPFAQPELRHLAAADLEPLVACKAIGHIEALRLMALVPGWQP